MKNPLWIVNSSLLLFFLGTLALMLLFKTSLPPQQSLTPRTMSHIQKPMPKIDLTQIYEHDLFNTYQKPSSAQPTEQQVQKVQVPQPPAPKIYQSQPRLIPEFLPPLDISLKGVIFNSQSEYSRAIIADKKTKQEQLYKIGDKIADANLIYIGRNKAIFIRSNGQQETFFVTEQDAKNDPLYSSEWEWSSAIKKLEDGSFVINTTLFKERIQSVAQLLDILDITTAFIRGRSIGCRIGDIKTNSLGSELGLEAGDIITAINGTPTTSTTDRVAIYKKIENAENNFRINVALKRKNQEKELTYILRKKAPKKIKTSKQFGSVPAGTPIKIDSKDFISPAQKDLEIAQQTVSQAEQNNSVASRLQQNDKKAMVQYGGKNALLQR